MSFNFSDLEVRANEGLLQFNNRIKQLPYIEVGRAFFDIKNYYGDSGDFSVLVKWNINFLSKLNDVMPEGGYFIKASKYQATDLHNEKIGVPVKVSLVANEGRIFINRMFVVYNERPYSMEFNGCYLEPWNIDEEYLKKEGFSIICPTCNSSSNFKRAGINNMGSGLISSYRIGSYNGSMTMGSYQLGSYRGSMLLDSYYRGSNIVYNSSNFIGNVKGKGALDKLGYGLDLI